MGAPSDQLNETVKHILSNTWTVPLSEITTALTVQTTKGVLHLAFSEICTQIEQGGYRTHGQEWTCVRQYEFNGAIAEKCLEC